MLRRTLLISGPIALAFAAIRANAAEEKDRVFKSASCQCCNNWMAHMMKSGFDLEGKDISNSDRTRLRVNLGIPPEIAGCHTAIIGGYIVEGHVPAEDVRRLLGDKPDAKGLVVAGMPAGSPGMEQDDGTVEPYNVLLLKKDGTTEVYARH